MSQRLPSVARSVSDSVRSAQIEDWGRSARVLAERYAHLIDRAEYIWQELEDLRRELGPDEEAMYQRLARLQAAVHAQQVASDLGPKLLNALVQLGLTPMARSGPAKGAKNDVGNPRPDQTPANRFDEIKAKREGRAARPV